MCEVGNSSFRTLNLTLTANGLPQTLVTCKEIKIVNREILKSYDLLKASKVLHQDILSDLYQKLYH